MSLHVERRVQPAVNKGAQAGVQGCDLHLVDLMYDGLLALYMLDNGSEPKDMEGFIAHLAEFLRDVDRKARQLGIDADDLHAAKYAYCAAVDEIILRSPFALRDDWERRPLQLTMFGDQLAGEHFYDHLERLRAGGAAHVQALEVFHMCMLLGFRGKYGLETSDKIPYLKVRLGEEIARMQGRNRSFAPHAERPDQIANSVRSDTSLWLMTASLMLAAVGAYATFSTSLDQSTNTTLSAYHQTVTMPARSANVTITLP